MVKLSQIDQKFSERENEYQMKQSQLKLENMTLLQRMEDYQKQNDQLQHQLNELTISFNESQIIGRINSPKFLVSPDKNIFVLNERTQASPQVSPQKNLASVSHYNSLNANFNSLNANNFNPRSSAEDASLQSQPSNAQSHVFASNNKLVAENLQQEFNLIIERKKFNNMNLNLPKQIQKPPEEPHDELQEDPHSTSQISVKSSHKTPGKIKSQTKVRFQQ